MPPLLVPYVALTVSIAHLALAAGVTLHVLSHNRNPGSAVSWIGLAWLSPVVGSLLYVLLGINRVRRRARSEGIDEPGDAVFEAVPAPSSTRRTGSDLSGHAAAMIASPQLAKMSRSVRVG